MRQEKLAPEEQRLLKKLEQFLAQGMLEKFAPVAQEHPLNLIPFDCPTPHLRAKQPTGAFDTLDMRYLRNSLAVSFGLPNNGLLLLGQPKAEKMFALVEVWQQFITTLDTFIIQPWPLLFDLASWDKSFSSLASWLSEELNQKYKIPKHIGAAWLAQNGLLIMLKGFEKLPVSLRTLCKVAIAEFQMQHHLTRLAISTTLSSFQMSSISATTSGYATQSTTLQSVTIT